MYNQIDGNMSHRWFRGKKVVLVSFPQGARQGRDEGGDFVNCQLISSVDLCFLDRRDMNKRKGNTFLAVICAALLCFSTPLCKRTQSPHIKILSPYKKTYLSTVSILCLCCFTLSVQSLGKSLLSSMHRGFRFRFRESQGLWCIISHTSVIGRVKCGTLTYMKSVVLRSFW